MIKTLETVDGRRISPDACDTGEGVESTSCSEEGCVCCKWELVFYGIFTSEALFGDKS